jgi:hypothetical protein
MLGRFREAVAKFEDALSYRDQSRVTKKGVDVANFAMMLEDLAGTPSQERTGDDDQVAD